MEILDGDLPGDLDAYERMEAMNADTQRNFQPVDSINKSLFAVASGATLGSIELYDIAPSSGYIGLAASAGIALVGLVRVARNGH